MTIQTELTSGYDPHRATTVQAFLPSEDERFSLPGDVTKARAIRNAEAALRLFGANATEILVFRQIADTTGRAAWHSTTEAAVNFRRQADMAREVGIGERQFRRIETSLQAFGVVARTTAANGYRGRRSGAAAPVAGISLEPCIANHAAITALLRQAETAERERQDTRLRASMARRRLGQGIGAVKDPDRKAELTERLGETERRLKPACLRTATHESLAAWLDAILGLERQVAAAGGPAEAAPSPGTAPERAAASGDPAECSGSGPQEITRIQADMSAAPDIGVRRHIQPTTETGNEACNPAGSGETGDEGGSGGSPPPCQGTRFRSREGRERKHRDGCRRRPHQPEDGRQTDRRDAAVAGLP